ncbi:hypothetical protein [Desulforamulus ruminis]|uniref:Uncharacterized protein n=1 Tax=Desulforamulus ruminis (strain ATCC 23193 / DSM 2154 / NCIMB 8452 / DL) TaxID=696281 RepID=F6DT10_DESRL|nr:hypothetical protein [Desulforamulus ruminis]AEG60004.1 hypothetical protein Desru_1740 [Desulforamulus ruminis DSM 2154]
MKIYAVVWQNVLQNQVRFFAESFAKLQLPTIDDKNYSKKIQINLLHAYSKVLLTT